MLISTIIPAILTAFIALVFTPKLPTARKTLSLRTWKYKLWEWNTAWMGLGLGLATTFLFVEGLKNLIGKPRPDLLSRCDLDLATVQQYAVGGEGSQLNLRDLLVSYTACRQPDRSKLDAGFLSFPSGHASCTHLQPLRLRLFSADHISTVSWAGMSYLALFLCSKFSISIPYLLPYPYRAQKASAAVDPSTQDPLMAGDNSDQSATSYTPVPLRDQAAAPPAYLFILPLIPIALATYVAGTRYSDFRHHGFDILFGATMGTVISWTSFRIYHMPIRRGAGWSWGPRSASRAFGTRFGNQGYVNERIAETRDLEAGDDSRQVHSANSSAP